MLLSRPWFRRALILLILTVSFLMAAGFWVLKTQSGAKQLIRFALAQVDADVSVDEVRGSMVEGLTLSTVTFASPGLAVTSDSIGLAIDAVSLLSGRVTVRYLNAGDVVIITLDKNEGASPEPDAGFELVDLDLPIDIVIQKLTVSQVSVGEQGQPLSVAINSLGASVSWIDTMLNLVELNVQSPFGSASAAGTVVTKGAYPVQLVVESTIRPDGLEPVRSTTTLDGTFQQLKIDHSTGAPYAITVSGDVRDALINPIVSLQAQASQTSLIGIRDDLPDVELQGSVDVSGTPDRLTAGGSLSGLVPEVGDAELFFAATLSGLIIRLQEAVVKIRDGETSAEVQLHGAIDLEQVRPHIDMKLEWTNLRWPPRGDSLMRSRQGSGSLNGSPDAYSFSLNGAVATRHEPNGNIELKARGDTKNLWIDSVSAAVLGGSVTGRGQLTMDKTTSFSASLQGSELDPQGLSADWPGSLSFELEGSGTASEDGVVADIAGFSGDGTLRGFPVNFNGSGRVAPGAFSAERLELRTGDTTISASGSMSERLDVEWTAKSTDLNSLWPGLSGTLDASGRAGGSPSAPLISLAVEGAAIRFKDLSVGTVDATVSYDAINEMDGVAAINVTEVVIGAYRAGHVAVDATGAINQHGINVQLADTLGQSRMRLEGALDETNRYQFSLTRLALDSPDLGDWSLVQPASGVASDSALTLSQTCLARDESTLCLEIDRSSEKLAANVSVADFPLSMVTHLVPTAVQAEGRVNGGGELVLSSDGTSSGNVRFDFDPLSIESVITGDAQLSSLQFGASSLTARAGQSGELEIAADFPLQSGGGLSVNGTVLASDRTFVERDIVGDLSLSLRSLSFVSGYVPQVGYAKGHIQGQVDLSGTVQRPQLVGSFKLDQGAFTLTDPGVEATDVSLELTGSLDNSFTLQGSATSGEGDISVEGEMQLRDEGHTGRFRLSGTAFQVVNTQNARVWASPDVLMSYENEALKLTGSVAIPRAAIEIDELPQGVIKVSRDQIIVGQSETGDKATIPLDSDLRLELGEDVNLSAFGLQAALEGAISIRQNNGKPATANGEIELIDGEYQAYGQQLTITTGRLVYAGGPLDSPGIDLRAIRNPTPEIEVGVSARGSIRQPEFSVFSSPAMSESDQLAYLLFGRPINAEATSESTLITRAALTLGMKGGDVLTQKLADELGVDQLGIESQGSADLSQASLVIGKYLSPELFVSYGIGLLEPVSTLKLEYALSSRWHLISESSTTRNSADVQFTYER